MHIVSYADKKYIHSTVQPLSNAHIGTRPLSFIEQLSSVWSLKCSSIKALSVFFVEVFLFCPFISGCTIHLLLSACYPLDVHREPFTRDHHASWVIDSRNDSPSLELDSTLLPCETLLSQFLTLGLPLPKPLKSCHVDSYSIVGQ